MFQREGIEYFDVITPVFKYSTVHLFFCTTAHHNWKRFSIIVKCAFINATLHEEIYVDQPEIFVKEGFENHVYLLQKKIYLLKQDAKAWNDMWQKILIKIGFTQSWADRWLYILQSGDKLVLLIVYVDEIKISENNDAMVQRIINEFQKRLTIRIDVEDSKFSGI